MVNPWNLQSADTCDSLPAAAATGRLLSFPDTPEALPAVPVLLSTRLQLELLLDEQLLDLRAVSEVILSDPGATLQVLRLIGEEYGLNSGRPVRMEDCIASLETEAWFEAVCGEASSPAAATAQVTAVWRRARLIAHCARQLAENTPCIRPEEAYLAGLLDGLGSMPALLGWKMFQPAEGDLGEQLARAWGLPVFLIAFFRDRQEVASAWTGLLSEAHSWAKNSEQVA